MMNILEAINKYRDTKKNLGEGADKIEIGTQDRLIFINRMEVNLYGQQVNLAVWLHNTYEELAKKEGWDSQKSCKVLFENLPKTNKNVMLEMAKKILE